MAESPWQRGPLLNIADRNAISQEWAARYDWTASTTKHWTVGTSFRMHGVDEVHSAVLALEDNFAAIDSSDLGCPGSHTDAQY